MLNTDFVRVGSRAFYSPRGSATADVLAYTLGDVLLRARRGSIRDVLIDVRKLDGFDNCRPPCPEWAPGLWGKMVADCLHVAMVARRKHVRSKFIVAAQQAMSANVFESEISAVDWLDSLCEDFRE